MNALYPLCKRSHFQKLLLSIVWEPPGLSAIRNVPVIYLKRFEILTGTINFPPLLWKLQLAFILSAFRFANEVQNYSSCFIVANDAPVWIVVSDHPREMYLKCWRKLKIEENLCIKFQSVFYEQLLYLRIHLNLIVQSCLTCLNQLSLGEWSLRWKELL